MENEFSVSKDYNPVQARLKEIILKPLYFDEAVGLALRLHSFVHDSLVGDGESFFDEIIKDISERTFNEASCSKGRTIAYNIWHITRIEDICTNILIANGNQVINDGDWLQRIGSSITETGNSLTAPEIAFFSREINKDELLNYRISVGKKTREILCGLRPTDMRRKPDSGQLERILDENAVSISPTAVWLIDYWRKKNVAELIQMPLTRHQVVHLSDCLRIKRMRMKL